MGGLTPLSFKFIKGSISVVATQCARRLGCRTEEREVMISMNEFPVATLLESISDDAPCGDDLSYDAAYMALERAMVGTPERQVGDTIIEAEDPDWRQVRQMCEGLLVRTKDLRIAVDLTLALTQTTGLSGFRDGLAVVAGFLQEHWDHVHPQLDPDDNNDPTERINIIATLAPEGGYQDEYRFAQRILTIPLTDSPQMGRFSMRDVLMASGQLEHAGDETPPDLAQIDAAFATTPYEKLEQTHQDAAGAAKLLEDIESVFAEKVGESSAPDLRRLREPVKQIRDLLVQKAAVPDTAGEDGTETTTAVDSTASYEAVATPGSGRTEAMALGNVASREDVVRAMDAICAYYKRFEPSSPVPLLLLRARRLVDKGFLDIIQDLTPDAVKQVEKLGGLGDGTE